MDRADAEEYTQALAQSLSGGWRQVLLAHRLGVPESLGLTTKEWADSLGEHIQLSMRQRREAVRELRETDPDMTQRAIAEILGVDDSTVSRDEAAIRAEDLQDASGGTGETACESPMDLQDATSEGEAEDTPAPLPDEPDLTPEEEAEMVQAALDIAGDPDGRIATATLRASYTRAAATLRGGLLALDPDEVSGVLEAHHLAEADRLERETSEWFSRLRAARLRGLHLVGEERG